MMDIDLNDLFINLVTAYRATDELALSYRDELFGMYTQSNRHYHNLLHLSDLFQELYPLKNQFEDWDCLQFCLFYHDSIYQVPANDNEERSAELAVQIMTELKINSQRINRCERMILATKNHNQTLDADSNIFLNADLAVLGKPWTIYLKYAKQIRKEYAFYPDSEYTEGRKYVLKKCLEKQVLFSNNYFSNKYEFQARANMTQELLLLESGEFNL